MHAYSISITVLSDTDGDGVFDDVDIDDDNDGILDILEDNPIIFNAKGSSSTGNTQDRTNAEGPIETEGSSANNGNSAELRNSGDTLTLDLGVTLPVGTVITLSMARDRSRTANSITISGGGTSLTLTNGDWSSSDTLKYFYFTLSAADDSLLFTLNSNEDMWVDGLQVIYGDPNYFDIDQDGIDNSLDLDSDNDGIPDNVEAQMTSGFTLSSNPPTVRADGSNAAYAQTGLIPPDTDNDGLPDYLDSDADNDLVTDCQESYLLNINICPVDNSSPGNTVGVNGLVEWAEPTGGDNYDRPSGLILTPGLILLEDEISGDTEKAYREAACGPAETNLTAYQWKTISFPCETGANGIEELLGASLGTYGDEANWVVYEQTGSYKADGKSETRLMDAGDPVEPGNGYWIIADADKTAKITRPLGSISQTATVVPDGTNYPGVPVSGAAFAEVMPYDDLPDSDSTDPRILMIGNPFFKKFQLSDIYYQNAAMGTTDYVSTATLTSGTSPLEPTVYIKDSSDITTGNYTAIVPETPGFSDEIPTMQGFWIKLNAGNTDTNKITYPFEK